MTRWLVLSALTAGCAPDTAPPPVAQPHIVLISLDTTRADRLGSYGYTKARTETLDKLARDGRRFEHAYSPAPLTIPAHISLFTGLYPPNHGVRGNGDGVMREDHHTLMRELKTMGYRTAASVSAFVTTRKWGFHHGFDAFFDAVPDTQNAWRGERPASQVIDDALGWVQESGFDTPLFVWTHLYDPHHPLQAPEPYATELSDRPYDAELAYVDDQVERLVKQFEGQPTLFIVVGDHGEGLGDHGELGHGMYVYDSTQRVPMFISGPGITPEVVESPVSLVDVLPTVLTHLGQPVPAGIDGHSAPHSAPIYMEAFMLEDRMGLAPHIGLIKDGKKLIDLPRPELYALNQDPGELDNVAASQSSETIKLKKALSDLGYPGRSDSSSMDLDPEVAAQLEALGYVTQAEAHDPDKTLPDPKDHRDLIRWTQRSERLLQAKKYGEADILLAKLLEQYPDLIRPATRRITALSQLGRGDEAIALAAEARARHPDDGNVAAIFAGLLAKAGRWNEAAELYREAADKLPWASHLKLRGVMSAAKIADNDTGALLEAEQYLRSDPDNAVLSGFVGLHYLRKRRVAEAMPLLSKGATADQPMLMVNFHLGAKAHQDKRLEDAERHLRAELQHHPANVMAARLLKDVLVTNDDWQGMISLASRVLEAGPSAEWSRIKAQGMFNLKQFAACRRVLDRAMTQHPDNPPLMLLDANTLKKEGKDQESLARFQQAQALWEQKKGR